MRFRTLPPPSTAELEKVTRSIAGGIYRLLERRGFGQNDDSEADAETRDESLLASLYAASFGLRIATGPREGQRVMRFGGWVYVEQIGSSKATRCVTLGGLSLHANVAVPAGDRQRLERLCRYVARPPLTIKRLSRLSDGRLLYGLSHPWRDGTTHVAFLPLELIEKLAALVPPPRVNLVRYHGVLAPAARHRAKVVPKRDTESPVPSTEAKPLERNHETRATSSQLFMGRVVAQSVCHRCARLPGMWWPDAYAVCRSFSRSDPGHS